MPWVRAWDTGVDHERMATIHRSEAQAIEAECQDACGSRPLAAVSVSAPTLRLRRLEHFYWCRGVPDERGRPTCPVARRPALPSCVDLKADRNMEMCPLDLSGLEVDVRGDASGITLSLAVKAVLVEELQRRAAHELEHKK